MVAAGTRSPCATTLAFIPSPTDDRTLVDAARSGDRAALDMLLRRHHDRLHAVCRRLAGNDADAGDALQETLIAIVRGLHRFDGRSAFSTWSYRVATNATLDELRRRKRRPVPGLPGEHDDSQTPPVTRPRPGSPAPGTVSGGVTPGPPVDGTVADRLDVDAALAQIPETFRVAVVLRDLCDLDYAEIAAILDLPPGTVRSRIARGRGQLADALGNHRPSPDRPTTAP